MISLNTKATKEFVEKHNIVPLLADYTDESEEITRWLHKFRRDGVPLTVIFPAEHQNEPIVLPDGVFFQETLLEKLKEATAARSSAQAEDVATAVR